MNDKLFSADIFSDLRMKKGVLFEDMQLQYRCIAKASRVTYIGEPFYCYYMAPGSISRGKYSLKHYDEVLNSEERIAYYKEYYPACVPLAYAMHIDICMSVVQKVLRIPEWKDLRNRLIRGVKAPLSNDVLAVMPKKVKYKRILFKLHPRILLLIVKVHDMLRIIRH